MHTGTLEGYEAANEGRMEWMEIVVGDVLLNASFSILFIFLIICIFYIFLIKLKRKE